MKPIVAIDPGTTESAYVVWNGEEIRDFAKIDNDKLLDFLFFSKALSPKQPLVIEQIRSYGMAVGATTLDTVFWSGRFAEAYGQFELIPRMDVKMHLCKNSRAKDSNITQALVDRFAYGVRNKGKGTKKEPGFFYGFAKDIWQAFALAVTYYDTRMP